MTITNTAQCPLTYSDKRTYMAAAIFIAGNLLLPQLFHAIPQGGMTWLPIYFFTLVGTFTYGWRVGLLTAVCSPLMSSALFGMPLAAMLPVVILKSLLLTAAAGYAASRTQRPTLLVLFGVVLVAQLLGTLGEWMLTGNFTTALGHFRLGIPGMLLQIFGGHLLLWRFMPKFQK